MKKKTNYATGHFAEKIAFWFLRLKGYRFVAKNFTVKRGTGAGEIDLIMTKGKTIIFFEVKKRRTYGAAAEAITIQNQMRVVKSSAVFLQKNPQYASFQMRYDAILFSEFHFLPCHIKNAWRIL
ncbi:MAG: YraN family protein [Alphaproteobacteria bacterium]|nr:YraN family protein [Alphaproteobacteria bacterium]